ncbi:MAG: hypothetical protein ACI9TY_000093 [Alphaproteobacteria bacterium]|jgi:hypothetical protein
MISKSKHPLTEGNTITNIKKQKGDKKPLMSIKDTDSIDEFAETALKELKTSKDVSEYVYMSANFSDRACPINKANLFEDTLVQQLINKGIIVIDFFKQRQRKDFILFTFLTNSYLFVFEVQLPKPNSADTLTKFLGDKKPSSPPPAGRKL